MIKLKFLLENAGCLFESERLIHCCAAENCGLNDYGRNLPHFVHERVLPP